MSGAHRATGRRRGADEAQFRRAVEELKASVPISAVVGRAIKLTRSGREWKGCCPFHEDRTPSFYVIDASEFAHCFGCGWSGDVIRFVMDREGVGFRDAFRMLANADLPTWTEAERTKAKAEEQLARLADEQDARKFYKESVPAGGTPTEVYLRARGITIPAPEFVRFGMVPSWRNKETGEWGRKRPAVICGAADGTGAVVGIQRIFFDGDDPARGKADCKLSLGTIRGSALRLAPIDSTVVLAEGPEDGLSIMQEGPGLPVLVPFGTSLMPQVQFPSVVKRVIIAGQNNTAGRVAVNKATIALAERGLSVDTAWPSAEFDDWNDQLRGVTR